MHCLVHELVHAAGVGYAEHGRKVAEIITKTAATIICAELGLDSTEESSFYLLSWSDGDIDEALKQLQAADQIAKKMEASIGPLGSPSGRSTPPGKSCASMFP